MKTTICTLFVAGMLTLAGCASTGMMGGGSKSTAKLQPGPQTPAATGEVSIGGADDPTGNNQVALQVEHLPPPEELGEELSTFVVWITPEGSEEPLNVGQLQYDPQDRQGSLDIVTPYKDFEIAVTAENAANPLEQGEVVVVKGKVDTR